MSKVDPLTFNILYLSRSYFLCQYSYFCTNSDYAKIQNIQDTFS